MHALTHCWTRLLAALGVFSAIVALCILSGRGVSADSPAEPTAQPTYAAIGVFQQGANGYTGASDVTISRTEPDTNFENQSLHLHCKDYTSLPEQQGVLLRFDLSSVPRNAQIGGATLSVATYDRNITDDLVVSLHVLSRTWRPARRRGIGRPWRNRGVRPAPTMDGTTVARTGKATRYSTSTCPPRPGITGTSKTLCNTG